MANSNIIGTYKIPAKFLGQMKRSIDSGYDGKNKRSIIGYLRKKEITDRGVFNLISKYKNGKLGEAEDLKPIEDFVKWLEQKFKGEARHIDNTNRVKMDIGMTNQFKKTHFKDKNKVSDSSTKPSNLATKSRDIFYGRNIYNEEELREIKRFHEIINRNKKQ